MLLIKASNSFRLWCKKKFEFLLYDKNVDLIFDFLFILLLLEYGRISIKNSCKWFFILAHNSCGCKIVLILK